MAIVEASQRTSGGRTLAHDVLQRLRSDILNCVLLPNQRLRFETLRDIYGASFSTLREALSWLASERLVIVEGQRGFAVAPISKKELMDVTDARVLVERECLAKSIANADEQSRFKILGAFHRLDRLESIKGRPFTPSPEWESAHSEFHEALVANSGSPTLMEIRQALFERARRYRRLSALTRAAPRDKTEEHREMMEAVVAGDLPLAQDLIERHIRATATNVLNAITEELPLIRSK